MSDPLRPSACARLLKALADPERLRIVDCLRSGPRNVSELAAELREELANVSHHLGVLRQAGLVLDRKDGKFVVYRLHPDIFRPATAGQASDCLDLGCCRLELNG
jgi:DNA-binding transcriptional ArsR family regulator